MSRLLPFLKTLLGLEVVVMEAVAWGVTGLELGFAMYERKLSLWYVFQTSAEGGWLLFSVTITLT